MHTPYLLSSQILETRYFSSTDFLSAPVGSRPSYIWRSIRSSRWVLEKGCKWIVGDGRSIRIWRDSWLSRAPSFRFISPRVVDSSCEFVSDLLDPIVGGWKDNVVRDNFLTFEAEEILIMHISLGLFEDELNEKNEYIQ